MKQAWNSGKRSGTDVIAPAVLIGALASFWLFVFFSANYTESTVTTELSEPRLTYYENEKSILEVFPDPTVKAGSTFNYIFHFTESHKHFEGKKLSVDVIHLETGHRLSPIQSSLITEYSPPEMMMERFIVSCALPLGGMWRFEVNFDGKKYADVLLEVGEPTWELSPLFTAENSELTGVENKVGIISPGFIAKQPNKYMWHLWGSKAELDGPLRVMAVKEGSPEMISVLYIKSFGTGIRGSTRTHPSMMELPEPGKWMLLPIVDERLVEGIVVEVLER
ncbi:DUF4871 domain-containing protein [Paenibacillus sp. L3-i20]|uniref:DUF4871 domain-containing protein n=1 Tax=Paenibacillus sp. L3-i20 TaxID=2905833 RepID=UPI001EDDCDAD|nr:DUF4871 domain-containing protein [Paenibacillus sp. L3-i20]GKU76289.1 hypothetical protein L3i20_v206860 [Paenibacillus sp. L3-i20]